MPKIVTNRPVNLPTAKWIAQSPYNRLSYLCNNNPQGVINWLVSKGVVVNDVNHDGIISAEEIYHALKDFIKPAFGSFDNFFAVTRNEIAHNDNAPSVWNIYITP